VAIDVCAQFDTVSYPMSTPEDLKETVRLVEAENRRCLARELDIRGPGRREAGRCRYVTGIQLPVDAGITYAS
jgi:hypothetical protein